MPLTVSVMVLAGRESGRCHLRTVRTEKARAEMGETPIGTVQMSYWIDPCGLDGRPINGGMSYANADTAEKARQTAERWLRPGSRLGSVYVVGREMRLGYQA